jgi:histidinol-phosphate aminotransferase
MSLSVKPNPQLGSLPVYQPGRPTEEVARELGLNAKDIIKLASNENPLGPSPKAMAAMRNAIDHLHLYPDGNAYYLKRRLAEKLELATGNLVLGNGSNEIIEFVGHAFMGPGTDVVVSQYCFAIYPIVGQLFGSKVITVPARDLGHDLDAMLRAITPATRVVFVANPNNPTGTLVAPEAVERFIEQVPENVLVVMDEAYFEFLENPLDLLPRIRAGQNTNLLIMRTFSKIFGLAGLRLGYGIGNSELISALEKIRQPFNINSIAQAGALAALDDEDHLTKTKSNNSDGLDYFDGELQRLGIEYVPSSANFVLAKVGDGARVFSELQKRGVITRPMAGYQLPEWIRFSIGTDAENQRCIAALDDVLKS